MLSVIAIAAALYLMFIIVREAVEELYSIGDKIDL